MSFSGSFPGSSFSDGGSGSPFGLPGPRKAEDEPTDVVQLGGLPRVDLLPEAFAAQDRFRRLQVGLVAAVALVLAASGGAYVLAASQVGRAEEDLAAQQARTTALQAEQAQYAEVPVVRGQVDAVRTAQTQAMATDVLWYRYTADLSQRLPQSLYLKTLTVTSTGASAGGDPAAAEAAAAAEVAGGQAPALGSITFSLGGQVQPDAADLLDVLSATPGLADAWVDSTTLVDGGTDGAVVSTGTGGTDIAAHADVTDEALSHRFDAPDAAAAATTTETTTTTETATETTGG